MPVADMPWTLLGACCLQFCVWGFCPCCVAHWLRESASFGKNHEPREMGWERHRLEIFEIGWYHSVLDVREQSWGAVTYMGLGGQCAGVRQSAHMESRYRVRVLVSDKV